MRNLLEQRLRDQERMVIFEALRRHNGHRENAAYELHIPLRTLYRRLANYRAAGHEVPGSRGTENQTRTHR